MAIQFYINEENNKKYVRVSTVANWGDESLKHVPEHVLNRKATVGTNVHSAINKFYKGGFCLEDYTEEEQGYLTSFLDAFNAEFAHGTQGDLIIAEHRLYSEKMKLTGQIDALFLNKCGRSECVLVDYKTSCNIREAYYIQMCLYAQLLRENGYSMINNDMLILQLTPKKKKKFQYHWIKFSDWKQATIDKYNAFKEANKEELMAELSD